MSKKKEEVNPINEEIVECPSLAYYDDVKKSVTLNTIYYGKDAKEEDLELTKLYPNSCSIASGYVLMSHVLLEHQYKKLIDFEEIKKYYKENEKFILLRFPMLNDYEEENRVETFFFEVIAQILEKSAHGNETEVIDDDLYNFINKKYEIITERIKNEKA